MQLLRAYGNELVAAFSCYCAELNVEEFWLVPIWISCVGFKPLLLKTVLYKGSFLMSGKLPLIVWTSGALRLCLLAAPPNAFPARIKEKIADITIIIPRVI
jgi:hypothetical protein